MSASVWFLAIAVVVSLVGITVVAWRHRQPQSFDSSIHDFSRRMSTLAPAGQEPPDGAGRVYPHRPGDDLPEDADAADGVEAEGDATGAADGDAEAAGPIEAEGDDDGAADDGDDGGDVLGPIDVDDAPMDADVVAGDQTAADSGPGVTDGP